MARTEVRTIHHALKGRLPQSELKGVATMIAVFRRWRRTVAGRRAIANLTPDQLKDIGLPEAFASNLDVEPGLITNLMSMR